VDQGKDPEPYNEVLEQREDRTTQSQRKLFPENRGAKRKLGITAAHMEDDDISRLADHFGVKEEEISEMGTRVSKRDLSLSESPAGDDSSATYGELLPDPSDNQEQVLSDLGFHNLARENLREALETLSERQKKVINERYFTEPPRKTPRDSRRPRNFPGEGKTDTGRVHRETQGIHMAEKLEIHP